MSDSIAELTIRSLLQDNRDYVVPMYQRNYAWGEGEITQLVQDILDYQQQGHENYYIGTLVVFKRADGSYEVIDGQQRFTSLTLLAIYLKNLHESKQDSKPAKRYPDMGWYSGINIGFESRPKSSRTFNALSQGIGTHKLNDERYNEGIVNGYELIQKALKLVDSIDLSLFANYLFDNVKIMRVEVPEDTDLNHYFEVMNNRGEQLEKHEILKAQLMSVFNQISDPDEKELCIRCLQKVWEACANMERYVQYGFTVQERHALFGRKDWGRFEAENFDDVANSLEVLDSSSSSRTLFEIVKKHSSNKPDDSNDSESSPERFNSVINFSNFLLHVLRVYTQEDVALDDKQLLSQFEEHLLSVNEPLEAVKSFTFALLKCKYLFDQYIIKREYSQSGDTWSLKRLKFYEQRKRSFSVSFINSFGDNEDGYEGVNRQVLMLLSAFHVSTPTLVYKHWLNAALYYLYYEDEIDSTAYLDYLENIAKRFVFDRFLANGDGQGYYQLIYLRKDDYYPKDVDFGSINSEKLTFGKIENNFVFNYLDYLIWLQSKDSDSVIKEFEFTFRSSVEHFYPQHPMDGHPNIDDEALHSFGNLCLISHSKNSKLSNYPPKAKLAHFSASIRDKKIDSLKLYKIIGLLEDREEWGQEEIKLHGKEMIELMLKSTARKNKKGDKDE